MSSPDKLSECESATVDPKCIGVALVEGSYEECQQSPVDGGLFCIDHDPEVIAAQIACGKAKLSTRIPEVDVDAAVQRLQRIRDDKVERGEAPLTTNVRDKDGSFVGYSIRTEVG